MDNNEIDMTLYDTIKSDEIREKMKKRIEAERLATELKIKFISNIEHGYERHVLRSFLNCYDESCQKDPYLPIRIEYYLFNIEDPDILINAIHDPNFEVRIIAYDYLPEGWDKYGYNDKDSHVEKYGKDRKAILEKYKTEISEIYKEVMKVL